MGYQGVVRSMNHEICMLDFNECTYIENAVLGTCRNNDCCNHLQ